MFPNRLLKFIILIFLLILTAIFSGCKGITTPGISQDTLSAVITANPTSGEAPLEVTFDASKSSAAQGNEIVSYEWDFGNGKTGEGGTVHHGFDSPGNYTVILNISDNKGAVNTSSVIIKVFQPTETVIEHNFNTQNGTEFDTGTGLKIIVPPSLIEGQMNLEVKYDSSPSQSASDLIKLHSNYSITITPQKGFQEKELMTSGMNKDQETTKVSFIFDVPEDVDPQSLAIFEWADEGWYLAGAGDIETIEQLGGVLSPDDKYISIEVPFKNSLSTPAVMNTNTFSLGNFIINKIDFLFAICPMVETGNIPENKDDYIEKKVIFQSLECEELGSGRGIPYKVGILNNSENLIDNSNWRPDWNQPDTGLYTDIYQILNLSEWYLMPSDDEDKKGVLTLRFGIEGGKCTVWLEADGDMLCLKWLLSAIKGVKISSTISSIFKMYIKNVGNSLMGDSVDTGKLVKETRKILEELGVELAKQGISLSLYGKAFTFGFKIGDLIKSIGTYLVMTHHSQPSCPYKNPGYWEWEITVPPIDNNPPIISDLTANPSSININQTTTIICSASDPDGDSLTYTWTKTGGTFEGNTTGPTITWRAPSTPDTYTVECEVSDGKESDSKSVDISVGEFDINGDITNVSPLTDPFILDTWYTTNVYVKNTGNTSHTFKVKTSEPSGTDFEVTEKSITLSAGSTNSVSFKYKFYGTEICRSLTFILYDSSNILLDTYTTGTLCQTGSTLGQVQLLGPSNGATLPLGNITFSWNSVSNATKYQFILYNSQGQVALDTIKTSTSAIVALNTEETITWKVRAGDNSGNWGAWSSIWSLTLKSTTTTTLSFTGLTPSQISTSTAPYQAILSASGSNFNNVNRVSFSWSGAASGSATWYKGDTDWNNKVTVNSDNSMTLKPGVVETNPTWSGTAYWTVTLRDTTGATASRSFTVTYTQLTPQVTGVDPSQPTANPSRQYIDILGNNFASNAQVTLQISSSVYPIPDDRTYFINSARIEVYVGLTDSGNWKVWITNPDGQKSNEYIFYVKP